MPLTELGLEGSADTGSPAVEPRTAGQVTLAILAINVLVFLLMVFSGVPFLSPGALQVLPWGADYGPLTTSGQWWRLVTSCFLHFGIIHIAFNLYILFRVGIVTEALFGKLRYAFLYLAAGVGGNLAGLFLHPKVVSAGASGAIFGVYGGLLAFLLVHRGVLPKDAISGMAKSAGIFIAYNLVYGLASPSTDMEAHIGGLLTGFAAGLALARSVAPGGIRPSRGWTYASIVGTLAAVAVALLLLPKSSADETAWTRAMLYAPHLAVSRNSLYYMGGISRADAERAAPVLVQTGFFGSGSAALLLNKDAAGTTLSVEFNADESRPATHESVTSKLENGKTILIHTSEPATPFPWNDPAVLGPIQGFGPRIAAALGGPPLTIRMLNQKGNLRNAVHIQDFDLPVGHADHLSYNAQAGRQQAQAFAAALQADGFLADRGSTVELDRASDGGDVYITVREGVWDQPRIVGGLETMMRKVAPAAGGLPLRLHLVDSYFRDRKVVQLEP